MEGQNVFQQIINRLNEDLEMEYGTGMQYIQHACMLQGNTHIKQMLLNQSKDEFHHAKMISDIIVYLGGVPTIEMCKRKTFKENVLMLKDDLQCEYIAMTRYLYRIKQLESYGLYDLSDKIKTLVKDEETHIENLKKILKIKNG